MTKYFTNSFFDRFNFCLLLDRCGVKAAPVEDGIIFDSRAFKRLHCAEMPHWVYLNRADMLSVLHTRPATKREINLMEDYYYAE